ncbi:MAG TPA: hypothetical protein VND65_20435 [Candidatus Binatia bacterium]|nr:hypothetical protein [Candidatus Binatia bacterium]
MEGLTGSKDQGARGGQANQDEIDRPGWFWESGRSIRHDEN